MISMFILIGKVIQKNEEKTTINVNGNEIDIILSKEMLTEVKENTTIGVKGLITSTGKSNEIRLIVDKLTFIRNEK